MTIEKLNAIIDYIEDNNGKKEILCGGEFLSKDLIYQTLPNLIAE